MARWHAGYLLCSFGSKQVTGRSCALRTSFQSPGKDPPTHTHTYTQSWFLETRKQLPGATPMCVAPKVAVNRFYE